MQKKCIVKILSVSLMMSSSCFATVKKFDHPIQTTVKLNSSTAMATQLKPIMLMNLHLTPGQIQRFTHFMPETTSLVVDKLPKKAQVDMSSTPVLDQGRHGTCVTFASSAAIDVLKGKGDYVSPLCNLELGRYLEQNGYAPSGWDGSWGTIVLNQMTNYGIVSTQTQKTKSCAGVNEYPSNEEKNLGNPLSIEDYHQLSENLSDDPKTSIVVETVLDVYQRLEDDASPIAYDGNKVLNAVKSILSDSVNHQNNRILTFGTILPYQHCDNGACATFNVSNDTWALTDEIIKDKTPELGGHEMVISGYDDNAVATDKAGKKHKGLLTLRNSWSTAAGDHGNFYMSYDYFKQYVLEVADVARVASE